MSLLSLVEPELPYDIKCLLISYLNTVDQTSLQITDCNLYNRLTKFYNTINFFKKEDEFGIHAIRNALIDVEILFNPISIGKVISFVPGLISDAGDLSHNELIRNACLQHLSIDISNISEESEVLAQTMSKIPGFGHASPGLLALVLYKRLSLIKHCIDVERLIVMTPEMASECIAIASIVGDLNIIKYFCSFTSPDNDSLNNAINYGHSDVIKYLCTFDNIYPSRSNDVILDAISYKERQHHRMSMFSYAFSQQLGEGFEDVKSIIMDMRKIAIRQDVDGSILLDTVKYLCTFDSVKSKITKNTIKCAIISDNEEVAKYLISLILDSPNERGHWLKNSETYKRGKVTEYLRSIGYEDPTGPEEPQIGSQQLFAISSFSSLLDSDDDDESDDMIIDI